jgi:hypothetical protein
VATTDEWRFPGLLGVTVDEFTNVVVVLGVEVAELFTAFPAVLHARPY